MLLILEGNEIFISKLDSNHPHADQPEVVMKNTSTFVVTG